MRKGVSAMNAKIEMNMQKVLRMIVNKVHIFFKFLVRIE